MMSLEDMKPSTLFSGAAILATTCYYVGSQGLLPAAIVATTSFGLLKAMRPVEEYYSKGLVFVARELLKYNYNDVEAFQKNGFAKEGGTAVNAIFSCVTAVFYNAPLTSAIVFTAQQLNGGNLLGLFALTAYTGIKVVATTAGVVSALGVAFILYQHYAPRPRNDTE